MAVRFIVGANRLHQREQNKNVPVDIKISVRFRNNLNLVHSKSKVGKPKVKIHPQVTSNQKIKNRVFYVYSSSFKCICSVRDTINIDLDNKPELPINCSTKICPFNFVLSALVCTF